MMNGPREAHGSRSHRGLSLSWRQAERAHSKKHTPFPQANPQTFLSEVFRAFPRVCGGGGCLEEVCAPAGPPDSVADVPLTLFHPEKKQRFGKLN